MRRPTLSETYDALLQKWHATCERARSLEEANNRAIIDAYGLCDILDPTVKIEDVALRCNPAARFSRRLGDVALQRRMREDMMRELVSYFVGCFFGRYSLAHPGLALADQDTQSDERILVIVDEATARTSLDLPEFDIASFEVAKSPLLEQAIEADGKKRNQVGSNRGKAGRRATAHDGADSFNTFLQAIFGEENVKDNLAFVESALGMGVRSYLVRDFAVDHAMRYQKRPIYWLFTSGNHSFNALVYMHCFGPDTVEHVRQQALRPIIEWLTLARSQLEALSVNECAVEERRKAANVERERVETALRELIQYDREILAPLDQQRVAFDLNDGVQHNYNRLGKAMRTISGLSSSA